MEINYTNSREDIINFHMRHYKETKTYRMLHKISLVFTIFITLIIVMLVLLVVLAKSLNVNIEADSTIIIMSFTVVDLISIFFREKYFKILFNRRLNKIYNYERASSYFSKVRLTISEDYLNLFTDLDIKNYKWKSIHDICLIDNYIFITTIAHDEILIPLSCFNSSEKKNYFLTTILRYTNLQLKKNYLTDI